LATERKEKRANNGAMTRGQGERLYGNVAKSGGGNMTTSMRFQEEKKKTSQSLGAKKVLALAIGKKGRRKDRREYAKRDLTRVRNDRSRGDGARPRRRGKTGESLPGVCQAKTQDLSTQQEGGGGDLASNRAKKPRREVRI